MKKLLIGLLAYALAVSAAHAQSTKAQINTEITTTFPDNTVGAITPTGLRTVTADIVNSIMPTAPVVSGNLACFSGTTGLLQDCASAPTPNAITSLTGDITGSGPGAAATTLATVNANVGSFGSATQAVQFTVNAKGLMTAAANVTVTPAIGSITGLGAGCATWLATPSSANLRGCLSDETGTGLAYFQGGDIGTPSAGVATNLTGTAAGLTAGTFSAGSATNLTSGTLPAARTNGHMNGTATNDNGAAGEVGEYIELDTVSGSAVSLTTGTTANVGAGISLTAGDWDVTVGAVFLPAGGTTVSNLACGSSTTSATLLTSPNKGGNFNGSWTFLTGGVQVVPCGTRRYSVSGTTTVFMVAQAVFAVSTMQAYGTIWARRRR